MKKLTLLGVTALLCLLLTAQENTPVKPLTVGDTVPDITFYSNANPGDSVKLSSLKYKLLIIDVWGAYCAPCMKLFPKLDSLQRYFKGPLQVVLLTANPVSFMVKAADSALHGFERKLHRQLNLLSVHTDSTTTDRIYYKVMVPHYTWLDENRRIIAVTGAEAITKENIQKLLAGEKIQVIQKTSYEAQSLAPGTTITVSLPKTSKP